MESKLTAYGCDSDVAGLCDVLWDRLRSVSPDRNTTGAFMCVCLHYKKCVYQHGNAACISFAMEASAFR